MILKNFNLIKGFVSIVGAIVEICYTTFNGSDEYVNCGNDASLDFSNTDPFSVSLHVKRDTLSQEMIFSKATQISPYEGYSIQFAANYIFFSLIVSNTNKLQIRTTQTFTNITDFFNIIVTYNGDDDANNCKIYIDGVSVAFTVLSNNLTTSFQTAYDVNIGAQNNGGTPFNGNIDKVIVYDKELTTGEVTTIYNYGRKSGLIGIGNEVSQWEMDTVDPVDEIGSNNGTSVNQDISNIICE